MMCKLFFSIENKPSVVCKRASSLDKYKDAYVFNFDLNIYIYTHLILIQDEPELGEVFMCITTAAVDDILMHS